MLFYINYKELKNHLILLEEEKKYIHKLKESINLAGQITSPDILWQLREVFQKLEYLEQGIIKNQIALERVVSDFQVLEEETRENLEQLEYDVKQLFS